MIDEINRTLAIDHEVQLVARMWETDAASDIGSDAQTTINDQFADDCDILIGVFWTRIGTPTADAESGSAEEVRRAIQRLHHTPGSKKVSLYFSDAAVRMSEVDVDQYGRLAKFKEEMCGEGLVTEYSSVREFELAVRYALEKHAREWGKSWGDKASSEVAITTASVPALAANPASDLDQGAEPGLLDSIEDAGSHLENSGAATEELGALLRDLGIAGERATERLNGVNPLAADAAKRGKAIANDLAKDFDRFSIEAGVQIDKAKTEFASALDSYSNAIAVAVDFDSPARDEGLRTSKSTLAELQRAMHSSAASLVSLKATIDALPRLTSTLNRSRRKASDVLAAFDSMVTEQSNQVDLVLTQIDSLLVE